MTDLPHTHLDHGAHDGCPACEQLKRDLERCRNESLVP